MFIKRIKIILSLLVAASLLFVFSACNSNEGARKISDDEEKAVSVTICASTGDREKVFGLFNFGHAFIVLKNNSDAPIDICGFNLPQNQSVTVSTWSITKKFGVWFNVESSLISAIDKYNDRVSVTCEISSRALEKLDDFLRDHNTWSVFSNCTEFSVNLFNLLAGEQNQIPISGIYTPKKLKKQIRRFESAQENNEISTDNNIGYLDKDGFFVGGYTLEN